MSVVEPAVIATDLGYPEGPVALPDGTVIVTELARARGCITLVDPQGGRRPIAQTGRPNGLVLDHDGVLWVAESLDPALLRVTLDGAVEQVAREVAGEPLLWPNDLCFGPDGALYLTDSGALVTDYMDGDDPREGWEDVPLDGKLFRIDRTTGEAETLDRGLAFANGVAFGPDGLLYLTETVTGNVYRYRPSDGWRREEFGNVLDPDWGGEGFRGPDGIAFDRAGLLYIAVFGQGDITVLDRDGRVAARHRTSGAAPTNCAFVTDGSGALLAVEDQHGTIERLDLGVEGLPLWT